VDFSVAQACGGLVEQQHLGFAGQGTGKVEHFLAPEIKLAGQAVLKGKQLQLVQNLGSLKSAGQNFLAIPC
jgi:hypothetical protein